MSTGWQFLDELELPVSSDAEYHLRTWLTSSLNPLNMHADVLNKVLKSAQEAVARLIRAEVAIKLERIKITLLVPAECTSKGQSWGFFRVEKSMNRTENTLAPGCAIEFYLYQEG
jgi:ribosome maturation protein Sdo1